MPGLTTRFTAALRAFREPALVANLLDPTNDLFGDFDYRRLRYAILWSFYENTAYRDVHNWAKLFRGQYGLYKFVRNIYSPMYRLGEFWKAHLMGGPLEARNGVAAALPIVADNERIAPALRVLWRASQWGQKKGLYTLYGPVLGDVALSVVDDVARGAVYLRVVHPGTLREVDLDPFGNVKGYIIEELRPSPGDPSGLTNVTYTEVAERSGEDVVYRTYLNQAAYAWGDKPAMWREPYGFVPLVLVKNIDVGADWGWSEAQANLGKYREADDLASKLHDQIRKIVDPVWIVSGVARKRHTDAQAKANRAEDDERPEREREEMPILYGSPGASATPLVAPLNITAVSRALRELLNELEREYPELALDSLRIAGTLTGRALELARSASRQKVVERRGVYDDALVRAQQMALAIGGWRDYAGYEGFGLDSFERGELAHAIGERPIFQVGELERLELQQQRASSEQALWEAWAVVREQGLGLEVFLGRMGLPQEEIEMIVAGIKN